MAKNIDLSNPKLARIFYDSLSSENETETGGESNDITKVPVSIKRITTNYSKEYRLFPNPVIDSTEPEPTNETQKVKRDLSHLLNLISRETIVEYHHEGLLRPDLVESIAASNREIGDPYFLIELLLNTKSLTEYYEKLLITDEDGYRSVSPEYWTKLQALSHFAQYISDKPDMVITDARTIPATKIIIEDPDSDSRYEVGINNCEIDGLTIHFRKDLSEEEKLLYRRKIAQILVKQRSKRLSGKYAPDVIIEISDVIGIENIERFTVEEYKLGRLDSYSPYKRRYHAKQVNFYIEMINRHIRRNLENGYPQPHLIQLEKPKIPIITGKISYFSNDGVESIEIPPNDNIYTPPLDFIRTTHNNNLLLGKAEEEIERYRARVEELAEDSERLKYELHMFREASELGKEFNIKDFSALIAAMNLFTNRNNVYQYQCGTVGIVIPRELSNEDVDTEIVIFRKGGVVGLLKRNNLTDLEEDLETEIISRGYITDNSGENIGTNELVTILSRTGTKILGSNNSSNPIRKIPFTTERLSLRNVTEAYDKILALIYREMHESYDRVDDTLSRYEEYLIKRGLSLFQLTDIGGIFTNNTKRINENTTKEERIILGISTFKNGVYHRNLADNRLGLPIYDLESVFREKLQCIGIITRNIGPRGNRDTLLISRPHLSKRSIYTSIYGNPSTAENVFFTEGIFDSVALNVLMQRAGIEEDQISILGFVGMHDAKRARDLLSQNVRSESQKYIGCFDRDETGTEKNQIFSNNIIWKELNSQLEVYNQTKEEKGRIILPTVDDLKDINDLLIWIDEGQKEEKQQLVNRVIQNIVRSSLVI